MALEIIQSFFGIALYAIAGFAFVKAFFNEGDLDLVERIVMGGFLALAIPSIFLIVLVMALGLPFSLVMVFLSYALLSAAALGYSIFFLKKKVL